MKSILGKVATALFLAIAIFSTSSFASVITKDLSVLGLQRSPGQVGWNFNADNTAGNLSFTLVGHRSLDGYNAKYTDIFHLILNGTEIFTGSFNMGGGGTNKVLFNPNGGTALTTTYGATDNVHNSRQTTWLGGITEITIPLNLLVGANKLDFQYTGYAQPLNDEWWSLSVAKITTATAASLSESSSYMLVIIGLLGIAGLRQKKM